eukprot:TRINITY_DN19738_c0_g1_i2.p1 TRINITY_DN19738_c0_g1~~TRINITY_DN19738_c0_g1_i2.p1  ORF type:complete len:190 (+),score=63.98 TRINITY_DN19738_c0_g1_i2:199-768(+)
MLADAAVRNQPNQERPNQERESQHQLTQAEKRHASFQRRRRTRRRSAVQTRCANCAEHDAVCSSCYASGREGARARRQLISSVHPTWSVQQRAAALYAAAARGDEDELAQLLDLGADPDCPSDLSGLPLPVTALHTACSRNHVDAARLLLLRGATPVQDRAGLYPYQLATSADASHDLRLLHDEFTGQL